MFLICLRCLIIYTGGIIFCCVACLVLHEYFGVFLVNTNISFHSTSLNLIEFYIGNTDNEEDTALWMFIFLIELD